MKRAVALLLMLLFCFLLLPGCNPEKSESPSDLTQTELTSSELSATDETSAEVSQGAVEEASSETAQPTASPVPAGTSTPKVLLTDGCVEAWLLNDGKTTSYARSALNGGTDAVQKWGVWLNNDTFGTVLDFSTQGSYARAGGTKVRLNGDFTLSAFIMAPVREQNDRVILCIGNEVRLYLSAVDGFALRLDAKGLKSVNDSGVSLADGKWHHVAVSKSGSRLVYYVDGKSVRTCTVSGTVALSSYDVTIGADQNGENGFDGSIAAVAVYQQAKTPDQITQITVKASDQTAKAPRMNLKRGIVIDRRQYYSPTPGESEGQTVREQDIVNCKNMGFDHVKLLLTPNHLIDANGHLIPGNMGYIDSVLSYVKKTGFRCILCLHPEKDFKATYLGNLQNFEKLITWYGELAAYIGARYSPDMVAIQLMTEPANNTGSVSWSWMSDRMWGAVRNELPDFTIITSSDSYGNLERLKKMSPASDQNLIYSFTTYEPYTIGFYSYSTNYGVLTGWSYVHDIPYPVEAGVDYTKAIENAIDLVPETYKAEIRASLWAYVRGERDLWMSNAYPCLYNAEWHRLRAKSLDDWRQKYGGNIHIMCVEFGCMDAETPGKLWHTAVDGFGIDPATRLLFVHDMRTAFDKYDIGWCYWSYNEAHTIFALDQHVYGQSPMPDAAKKMFDYEMLNYGLGIKTLV